MSMVINTNVQATRTHGVYNRNTSAMNDAMTRVATAQKINSAKDGASVYAISERMRSQIRANDQANQNTQNDSALLKTAQGGIGNTLAILNTLKERAINSANDSNLNLNRSDIATEVQQLVLQIDDNANKVKFNGRTLLNGAVDNTVGKLNGSSAVIANTGASYTENPTATSTHAVYNITGMKTWASGSSADATSDTKLVDLAKVGATDKFQLSFNAGDKITFNWQENGVAVKKELTITNTTKLSDMSGAFRTSNVDFKFLGAGTDELESQDGAGSVGSGVVSPNQVLNKDDLSKQMTATDAGGVGLYAIGKKDVRVTDFSVTVTSKSSTGDMVTNEEAQKLFTFKGVQQSFGPTTEGSNAVFSSALYFDDGTAASNASKGLSAGSGNATLFKDLKLGDGSTAVFTTDTTKIGITIDSNTEFKIDADSSISDLNDELARRGYDVRAYLLKAGDNIAYEGTNVTRGSGENETPLKAMANALYFVAGDGKDISSIAIKAYKAGEAADTDPVENSGLKNITSLQTRGTGASSTSTTAPLTFFVGGEPNFGIDVSISKMTANSLLGANADNFANKFLTKEGAQSALTVIDEAINRALNEQTKLGAVEARLGYTSDNLSTMNENLEASDSVMRDADLAKEMTNYMKFSVLSQAAQYMLAQSGQNAFSVLNLLQQ